MGISAKVTFFNKINLKAFSHLWDSLYSIQQIYSVDIKCIYLYIQSGTFLNIIF